MMKNLEVVEKGWVHDIKKLLDEDAPTGIFFIALREVPLDHTVLISANIKFRGLAELLRHLADDYDQYADENGEPRANLQ